MPSSLDTQLICHEWSKTGLRVPDRLMRELEAALQKHLGQVTQTRLVPQPPQHDEQDTIGGIFQIVERGSGALVEGSFARLSQRNVR